MNKKKPLIKRLNELAETRVPEEHASSDPATNENVSELDTLAELYGDSGSASDGDMIESDERDEKSALNVLYADRPDILNDVTAEAEPKHIVAEKVENEESGETEPNDDVERDTSENPNGSGTLTVGGNNSLASAVAVRRIDRKSVV